MRTVMIVDDEPVERFIIEEIIGRSAQPWRVVPFADVGKALNFISFSIVHGGAWPELILCDLLMPLSDGLEFLRGLNKLAYGAGTRSRIIMLTISEDHEKIKLAMTLGASAVVAKPFSIDKWNAICHSISE